jgi:hypothetical protein
MAKLYVTEYEGGLRLTMPIAGPRALVDQTPVVIGAGSLQSAPFSAATRLIRIETDSICSFAIGLNPTATVNNARLNANDREYFYVNPGDIIAVIANT